jgi:hypothetical protein
MEYCYVCGSTDTVASVTIGVDAKDSGTFNENICLWCREQIIININEFKKNNQ